MVSWFRKYRPNIPAHIPPHIPKWAVLSLVMNGLLFFTLLAVEDDRNAKAERLVDSSPPMLALDTDADATVSAAISDVVIPGSSLDLPRPNGDRKLTYEEHVAHLAERAKAMANKNPEHLTVLLGDSLSLWFPGELMPGKRAWINQSISGERTKGLLNRLDLLKENEIEAVFLMIGINDLIWGESDEDIVKNYKEIVKALKAKHPKTQIVVQSILPHSGENSTWESRDRLIALPSDRIVSMNNTLRQIAKDNGAYYLDLYPIFVTGEGTLRSDLTTDGLHLNREGYLVWRSAIALYAQLELQPPPTISKVNASATTPKAATTAPTTPTTNTVSTVN